MHRSITSLDQLRSAELGELLPVLLEHVERVPVFEAFKDNQASAELGSEVAREPALADNEPVVPEPFEHAQSFLCYLEFFGIDRLSGSKLRENAIGGARR